MKKICIGLLLIFPFFVLGQNFNFKISGSFTVSSLFMNDLINESTGDLSREALLSGEYDVLFAGNEIYNIHNVYRQSSPKVGFNLSGIGNLKILPSLSIRLGLDMQYIRYKREVERVVPVLGEYSSVNFEAYKNTLVLKDTSYQMTVAALYLSLPLGIEYTSLNQGYSIYGGLGFYAKLFDRNEPHREAYLGVWEGDNSTSVFINPLLEEFFIAAQVGFSKKIKDRINFECQVVYGISNIIEEREYNSLGVYSFNKQKSRLQQVSLGVSYKLF